MKICVIGAGAIDGLFGPTCHAAERVSVITRGAHLASIVGTGLCLIEERQEIVARVAASDRVADVGEQDLIIPGMNAHQVVAESGYFLRDQSRGSTTSGGCKQKRRKCTWSGAGKRCHRNA